jgi:hypothetical protein
MEDNYHDQQAEGLISMDRLRSKLASLGEERADLERRVAELSHSEERLRELEVLPQMVEEYLRDLPHLLELEPVVREYETSAPEPTEGDPLSALYTITPDRIRFLPEEELAEKHRALEEKRARRFRELYAMLNLNVVCHKDVLATLVGGDEAVAFIIVESLDRSLGHIWSAPFSLGAPLQQKCRSSHIEGGASLTIKPTSIYCSLTIPRVKPEPLKAPPRPAAATPPASRRQSQVPHQRYPAAHRGA